jgi:hypothetical protein
MLHKSWLLQPLRRLEKFLLLAVFIPIRLLKISKAS